MRGPAPRVGATPNREAIDAVGRYFAWGDDRGPWGATPGSADATINEWG